MSADVSLVEIFHSAQGEGPEVGRSTIFVRFGGCDLRCRWCDSPGTWRATTRGRRELEPGSEQFAEFQNPVSPQQVADWVDALDSRASTWVSLTGGEPLLQADAVESLVAELAARGRKLYLETHGLHVAALRRVAPRIDLVSMDWKLASDVRVASDSGLAPTEDFHASHVDFLREALHAKSVYVKVVLTPATRDEELEAMWQSIAGVSKAVPLVLQPVTPRGGTKNTPPAAQLLAWQRRAEAILDDVRLIPQTHPFYGAL